MPYDDPDGAEKFQILSPVRMRPHGVLELNRRIQRRFRAAEIKNAFNPWATSLGEEGIVLRDKVIQLRNGNRKGYDGKPKPRSTSRMARSGSSHGTTTAG